MDLDKPYDFIGKVALQCIKRDGVTRLMMGAFMSGEPFEKNNEHRWPVFKAGRRTGEVTSAVYSPRLKQNIGFVLADIEHAAPGTRLTVATAEGERDLEVTTLPFVDPDKKIPRAPLR